MCGYLAEDMDLFGFFMCFVTSGDTGAYFAVEVGKRKLFERISPNGLMKVLLVVLFSLFVSVCFSLFFITDLPLYHAVILGYFSSLVW